MKLENIKEIKGKIILKTGLHIGAGDVEMHIGGTDNPVVKHPFTNEPYIPGSSLKGKVRSLLELKSGLMHYTEGEPISVQYLNSVQGDQKELATNILKLFGASGANADSTREIGPARVSFSDCYFTEEVRNKINRGEMVATEIKAENSINRITSTANPRFTERVPANVEFEFTITLKKFAGDSEKLENLLLEGLKLLELDALGGSGSRGYGRVSFCFEDKALDEKFKQSTPF